MYLENFFVTIRHAKYASFYRAITHRSKTQPSYSPALNNLCFISVAPTTCVSHAFVYNGRRKQDHLPSYLYV